MAPTSTTRPNRATKLQRTAKGLSRRGARAPATPIESMIPMARTTTSVPPAGATDTWCCCGHRHTHKSAKVERCEASLASVRRASRYRRWAATASQGEVGAFDEEIAQDSWGFHRHGGSGGRVTCGRNWARLGRLRAGCDLSG